MASGRKYTGSDSAHSGGNIFICGMQWPENGNEGARAVVSNGVLSGKSTREKGILYECSQPDPGHSAPTLRIYQTDQD